MAIQPWGQASGPGHLAPVVQQARRRGPIITNAVGVANQPSFPLGGHGGDSRPVH